MKRKEIRLPGPILLLFILAIAIFGGPSELPAARSPLEMDVKPGVTAAQAKYLKTAVQDVFRFFLENYRINLHKQMRLIAAPDEEVYAAVLMKDFKMTWTKAQQAAKQTAGVATESKDQYILAVKVEAAESTAAIMKRTCHEMIHWYQIREAGQQKTDQHKWLMEGVANVLACHLVGARQSGELDRYRQKCLITLKQASAIPALEVLDSRKDWQAAMDKYGGGVIYDKAGLAVLELAQRAGIKSLFDFYRHLKHQTPAKAFRMAFKVNLRDFQKEMDQKFSN